MLRTILVCMLIGLALPALAVGKVTVDPNATSAAAKEDQDLKIDTRLTKTVTLSATRACVSTVLEELTKSTGVVFKAGYNNEDWQVRDRKMNVFVKDVPLVELMNSISHVMKFKWERKGADGKSADGKAGISGSERSGNPETWQYRLYMDRRTLLDAEAQRSRAEAKAEAEKAKRRANALDQYSDLKNLTEAQKAQLKTQNPLLYVIAQGGLGDSVGSFFKDVPAAGEAVAAGQTLRMTGASLSPSARASLLRSMQAEQSLEARFNPGQTRQASIPQDLDMSNVNIAINEGIEQMNGQPGSSLLLGELKVTYDGHSVSAPVIDCDSDAAKMVGQMLIESDEQQRPVEEVMKEHMPEFMGAMMKVMKTEAGGEPVIEHPDDPALAAKVKLDPHAIELPDIEKDLAEKSKISVVADSFSADPFSLDPSNPVFSGKQPVSVDTEIRSILDKISDTYLYNWSKQGMVIELRDRNWFKKRAAQIPEAWIKKWRDEYTKTFTLDIDTLSQIAQLTQEQMNANVMFDAVLRPCVYPIIANRELLRFYAGLSSGQLTMLLADSGLDFAALSPDQVTQAAKFVDSKRAGLLDSAAKLALVCERKPDGKGHAFSFALVVDDKKGTADWTIAVPDYTPPAPRPKITKPVDASAGASSSNNAQPVK